MKSELPILSSHVSCFLLSISNLIDKYLLPSSSQIPLAVALGVEIMQSWTIW